MKIDGTSHCENTVGLDLLISRDNKNTSRIISSAAVAAVTLIARHATIIASYDETPMSCDLGSVVLIEPNSK